MRNREARQLVAGETIRSLPSALGASRLAQRYTHTVAYIGGPMFAPWIVTTEGVQFSPWEVERVGQAPMGGPAARARKSRGARA